MTITTERLDVIVEKLSEALKVGGGSGEAFHAMLEAREALTEISISAKHGVLEVK